MSANNGDVLLTPATPTADDAGVCTLPIKILPFERSKTKDGRMRDKVAIVGFAGTTRTWVPYDDDEWEIWGLNEAHRQTWMRRITRWHQYHQAWDFTKQNNPSYQEHWEWLQKEHLFPIYMQEHYPNIPSSVKYPLDEVCETLFSNARRGAGKDATTMVKYFTSSFAYMCALALYLGFKTIGVWGFEMATDTEYRYQKGSTEYLLGVAVGMGVEIYVPEPCKLLNAELYGWRCSRMINRQRLEFLQRRHQGFFDRANVELQRIAGRREEAITLVNKSKTAAEKKTYSIRSQELMQAEINALAKARELMGWVRCYESLIKTVDNMHAGKDPGDGFLGPEGDLDPAAEQAVQDAAEAKARADAEKELEVSE